MLVILEETIMYEYFIISNTYLFNMKIADKLYNIKRYRNTDEMYLNLKLRRKWEDSHNSNINNKSNINNNSNIPYNSTMIQ